MSMDSKEAIRAKALELALMNRPGGFSSVSELLLEAGKIAAFIEGARVFIEGAPVEGCAPGGVTEGEDVLGKVFWFEALEKNVTLRRVFLELLKVAWEIKRPWGQSDWRHEIYKVLYDCGLVLGHTSKPPYGGTEFVMDVPEDEASNIVLGLMARALGVEPSKSNQNTTPPIEEA